MSTILLSFWSLQFQSRTRYLNACKLKPSGEPNQSEKTSKALKLNERGRSQTHTSLNESADPPWCPHSYVVDAFLQQLHLLFYLCKKKRHRQSFYEIIHSSQSTHRLWLTVISTTLICFAKSFTALASPLKLVSCLWMTQTNIIPVTLIWKC